MALSWWPILPLVLALAGLPAAPAAGAWDWPVVGPVIRAFAPPASPYGAGHRGIDIAAPPGSAVVAVDAGTVSFAGPVGGELFLTIDHGGGVSSTYSWLSRLLVRRGDRVARGQSVARTGQGHPGSDVSHLHLGARLNGSYVDPLELLGPVSVSGMIRLAPLAQVAG